MSSRPNPVPDTDEEVNIKGEASFSEQDRNYCGSSDVTHENSKIREMLIDFYQKYNPEKVGTIDFILERYQGKESDLLQDLREKYREKISEHELASVIPIPICDEMPSRGSSSDEVISHQLNGAIERFIGGWGRGVDGTSILSVSTAKRK